MKTDFRSNFTVHYTLNEIFFICVLFSFTFSNPPSVFCTYFVVTFSSISYFVDSQT